MSRRSVPTRQLDAGSAHLLTGRSSQVNYETPSRLQTSHLVFPADTESPCQMRVSWLVGDIGAAIRCGALLLWHRPALLRMRLGARR